MLFEKVIIMKDRNKQCKPMRGPFDVPTKREPLFLF